MPVAVANRGLKRVCTNCGARYYDFNRRPVACPTCATEFSPEIKVKSRRGRAVLEEEDAVSPATAADESVEAANEDSQTPEGEETVSLEEVEEMEEGEDAEEEVADADLDVEDLDDDLDDDDDEEEGEEEDEKEGK